LAVRDALDVLPSLAVPKSVAPNVAPTPADSCVILRIADKMGEMGNHHGTSHRARSINAKDSPQATCDESQKEPAKGVEPLTPALRMRCSAN
jgi:hypothetical protein